MKPNTRKIMLTCRAALRIAVVVSLFLQQAAIAETLRVPQDFDTIQAAVDAAQEGDTVRVGRGVYGENVIVDKSDLWLRGAHGAVMDGSDLGGIGLCVLRAEDVRITGFTVRNFERGIVLIDSAYCQVSFNEVHDSLDQNPDDGAFNMADGITLLGADHCDICFNYIHDNGHNGVFLLGTFSNAVCFNVIITHGVQTGAAVAGCGIQLSGAVANDGNDLIGNYIEDSAWGILFGPTGDAADNLVKLNDIQENRRAGIAVRGTGVVGNVIELNDARDNGLSNLSPSFEFDLFEDGDVDNEWQFNLGTSNF